MLLQELPIEMLLHIFDNLSTEELWLTVRVTCRHFHTILLRNSYWTQRAQKQFGVYLPGRLKEHDKLSDDFIEVQRSRAVEKVVDRWGEADALASPTITTTHYATIDAICQFRSPQHKRMCFTAARDRNIVLWDIDAMKRKDESDKWIATKVEDAHQGWIWNMCMLDSAEMYSASWDGTLKQWFFTESEIKLGAQHSFGPAVLSCVSDNSRLIYASTFCSGPIACDTRDNLNVVKTLNCHRKPVYSLATGHDTNYIYSIGEDDRIVMVDKRQFTKPVHSWRAQHMSRVHYSAGYLAVSFRVGRIIFLNPTTLEVENELWVDPENATKSSDNMMKAHFCMSLNTGAFCCAYGQMMKLYTPGLKPSLLCSYETDTLISKVDCTEDAVVVGSGLGSLCFWH